MTGSKNNIFGKKLANLHSVDHAKQVEERLNYIKDARAENLRLRDKAQNKDREQVIAQYLAGWTVNQIASKLAFTREFVRQTITDFNNSPKAPSDEIKSDSENQVNNSEDTCCVMAGKDGIHNTHCIHFKIENDNSDDLIAELDEAVKGTELEAISDLANNT